MASPVDHQPVALAERTPRFVPLSEGGQRRNRPADALLAQFTIVVGSLGHTRRAIESVACSASQAAAQQRLPWSWAWKRARQQAGTRTSGIALSEPRWQRLQAGGDPYWSAIGGDALPLEPR
jgi:hypothetical protein